MGSGWLVNQIMIQKKTYIGWRKREFLNEFFYEWLYCRYSILMRCNISIKILFFLFFYQTFTRPKVLVCIIRQFVNYALKNFCIVWINVLSHIIKKDVWQKAAEHDKSLSSLLELRKSVFPMHVYKYCKHYIAESARLWLWHDLFWYRILIFYWIWRKYFSAFKT